MLDSLNRIVTLKVGDLPERNDVPKRIGFLDLQNLDMQSVLN